MLLPRNPTRHRQGAPAPDAGRFSPLNAPQRALIDGFLAEAESWAMRQARRSYRHLPAELHEQAFDQAAMALRTGAPSDLDRRSLYAALAERLDEELRRIHIGWSLNQTRAGVATDNGPSGPTVVSRHPVTSFIEDALGGLERAVLQLELGAGRDSHTVRAALRLGPRQYARHRELGLGKLRGAIAGGISGQVCAQHLDAVTLAATGDRDAADRLASGPHRCRACAREAAGLRRILQQRLALAPWPFVIKPAGALAAKLGALGALFGGKSAAAGGGTLSLAGAGGTTSTKIVAAVVAGAAVASGGVAAIGAGSAPVSSTAPAAAVKAAPVSSAASRTSGTTTERASAMQRSAAERRRVAAKKRTATASVPAPTAPATTAARSPSEPADPTPSTTASEPSVTEPARKTVDGVKKTVDRITRKLPVKVPKVDELAPGLDPTLDKVGGMVDGLLQPKR